MNLFKRKIMSWEEFTTKSIEMEFWLFRDKTARQSLKNLESKGE